MYVSAGLLRQLMLLDKETTGVLQLYLKDMDDIPAVQERLRQKLDAAGYRVMEPAAQRVLDEVRVGEPRGLDRAEARRHQLGGRDVVHHLDPRHGQRPGRGS